MKKDLKYFEKNAEGDYITTPISVLRYITELEESLNSPIKAIYETVLVHVSRTWERIRLEQPYEEMPLDNIASVESIREIAFSLMENAIIKEFTQTWDGLVWDKEGDGCSDAFIERVAREIIIKDFL